MEIKFVLLLKKNFKLSSLKKSKSIFLKKVLKNILSRRDNFLLKKKMVICRNLLLFILEIAFNYDNSFINLLDLEVIFGKLRLNESA